MKAVVIREAGGPEVLKVESRPVPSPRTGQVLIRVKAFGLNRSELFTRQVRTHYIRCFIHVRVQYTALLNITIHVTEIFFPSDCLTGRRTEGFV
jgi:hypothetical protein